MGADTIPPFCAVWHYRPEKYCSCTRRPLLLQQSGGDRLAHGLYHSEVLQRMLHRQVVVRARFQTSHIAAQEVRLKRMTGSSTGYSTHGRIAFALYSGNPLPRPEQIAQLLKRQRRVSITAAAAAAAQQFCQITFRQRRRLRLRQAYMCLRHCCRGLHQRRLRQPELLIGHKRRAYRI